MAPQGWMRAELPQHPVYGQLRKAAPHPPLRGTFPRRGKAFYMKTEKTYEQR